MLHTKEQLQGIPRGRRKVAWVGRGVGVVFVMDGKIFLSGKCEEVGSKIGRWGFSENSREHR